MLAKPTCALAESVLTSQTYRPQGAPQLEHEETKSYFYY